jgi:hypothetical protein
LVLSAAEAVITAENAPTTVMDSPLVSLIDLNRDGLPDLLQTDRDGGRHRAYRNLGPEDETPGSPIRFADAEDLPSTDGRATAYQLADGQVELADMNGDGRADLVHTSLAREVAYFPNSGALGWEARRPMPASAQAPPATAAIAAARTADLDFDKRMDVVLSTERGYSVWYNRPGDAWTTEVRTDGARADGRVMQFTDSGFDLVDINGDRLNDAARIRPTAIVYAASQGHGRFADAIAIPIPDTVLTDGPDGQLARAKLTDINGDGLADLVLERALPGELWFWLNLGTDRLSNRYRVTDMPHQFGGNTAVRWADLNGNGTTDLIYADSTANQRIRMLDLGQLIAGSAHPHLLTEIDNGLGAITRIAYRTSTAHALDAAAAGEPWTSTIPFPVQVVSQVTTTPSMDLDATPGIDQIVKTYHYTDGFYDERERQFRGFATVEVIEHGDSTAPTRITEHGFFTGGPDGIDNDDDGATDEVSPRTTAKRTP